MTIDSFQGENRWLSNFWPAVVVGYDHIVYPSVEHGYVAAKTLDLEVRLIISKVESPGKVKRIGRKLTLRPNWENLKYSVMEYLLRQKFSDPVLQEQLLSTGDQELIEGNTWGDVYWGVCDGKGENNLGRLLMELRREYRLAKDYKL